MSSASRLGSKGARASQRCGAVGLGLLACCALLTPRPAVAASGTLTGSWLVQAQARTTGTCDASGPASRIERWQLRQRGAALTVQVRDAPGFKRLTGAATRDGVVLAGMSDSGRRVGQVELLSTWQVVVSRSGDALQGRRSVTRHKRVGQGRYVPCVAHWSVVAARGAGAQAVEALARALVDQLAQAVRQLTTQVRQARHDEARVRALAQDFQAIAKRHKARETPVHARLTAAQRRRVDVYAKGTLGPLMKRFTAAVLGPSAPRGRR